jgi:hypothetical protein
VAQRGSAAGRQMYEVFHNLVTELESLTKKMNAVAKVEGALLNRLLTTHGLEAIDWEATQTIGTTTQ